MLNSAKKIPKNTVINIKQQRSESHILGVLPLQHCSSPWYKTPLPHNVYCVDTRVDYIVQNGHIDLKISKIIPYFEIVLADTDDLLSGN